jgi:hypothetical protein
VAFVDSLVSRRRYALKLYLSSPVFDAESSIYEQPLHPFHRFLPPLRSIIRGDEAPHEVDAGLEPPGVSDGSSSVKLPDALSPCIVMEAGESLDRWTAGENEGAARGVEGIDAVTAYQVCMSLIAWPS